MDPLRDRHERPDGAGVTSAKDLLEAAESGIFPYVTGPHYEWMERLEHEQMPNQKAMAHVIRVLLNQYKRQRSGRFSPSGMGGCSRRMLFGYAGAPQLPADSGSTEIFEHGTLVGLRWQIEGLTMGWMQEAEFWVEDPDLLVGGSLDGKNADDSVFEMKSAAPSVFNKVVAEQRAPKFEHLMQTTTYMMLLGADFASIVYEDRAYGNFHEFRVERDAKVEREVIRRLRSYKAYAEEDELPDMLLDCEMRVGKTYKWCPYRKICPTVNSVSEAAALPQTHVAEGPVVPLGAALPSWAQDLLRHLELAESAS